jgi:hypothetical protein
MSKGQIHGIIMRPCATTEENYDKIYQTTEFYTQAGFLAQYQKHLAALDITAECAKIYLAKNWELVKDWSGLEVKITDNTNKTTEYFVYKPNETRNWNTKLEAIRRMVEDMDKKNKEKHNPIETVTGVVLDPTDGDFSLTINGKDHLWIDDESVIIIADYVENQLNQTHEEGSVQIS